MTSIVDSNWNQQIVRTLPASLQKVWAVVSDFKTFPRTTVDKIEIISGDSGVVGSIRKVYYSNNGKSYYATEELTHFDAADYSVATKMLETDDLAGGFQTFVKLSKDSEDETQVQWYFTLTNPPAQPEIMEPIFVTVFNIEIDDLARRATA